MNPSLVTVTCPACKGEGTYRMGCSRGVCHVCRGRTYLRRQVRGVPSISESPNQGKRGGESKLKACTLLVLGVLACSSSSEGIRTALDAAEAEAGRAPSRGPAAIDAGTAADVVPDAVLVPDAMPVPDAIPVPDVVPVLVRDVAPTSPTTWPICELPGDGSVWGTNLQCKGRVAYGDAGIILCWEVTEVDGYAGAHPCVALAREVRPGVGEITRAYVTSCQECPL